MRIQTVDGSSSTVSDSFRQASRWEANGSGLHMIMKGRVKGNQGLIN